VELRKNVYLEILPRKFTTEHRRNLAMSRGVSVDWRKHKESLSIRFSNNRYPQIFENLLREFGINFKKYFQNNTFHFHMLGKNAFDFYSILGTLTIKRKNQKIINFLKFKGGEKSDVMGNKNFSNVSVFV